MYTRRDALRMVSLGAGLGLTGLGGLSLPKSAFAADDPVGVILMGYSLAIHIPSVAALNDILPTLQGHDRAKITRIEQIRTITQSLMSGSARFGDSDFLSAMRAVQAGADLVAIGNVYVNTSLVLVVKSDKVKTTKDLLKPDVHIAINGKGDGTYVSWAGVLIEQGLDPSKVNTLEVGGSGSRMRALLAGRVDGCAMHFDQATEVVKQGHFEILVKPWDSYHPWINEVWVTSSKELDNPQNKRSAVDLVKATIIAFRKANSDFDWYADKYRKYATIPHAKTATDEQIRVVWKSLKDDVKAWPDDMNFKVANAKKLLPVYQKTNILRSDVDFNKFIDTSYVEQALAELEAEKG